MMGRHNRDQGQLFYSFCLDEAVPDDHRAREIAAVLDLSWVHAELAPYYPSSAGRRSMCSDPLSLRPSSARSLARTGTRTVTHKRRNYLIDVKFGVIMDVEASRAIRQAEVGVAKTMIERTEARFGLKPERLAADTA